MDTPFDEIVADAMKLPLRNRVKLAQRLVSSLDEQIDTDVETLWPAEAERRLEELRTGKAIIALARKLLGIIYRTLKNNWVFEDFPNFVLAEEAAA